MFIIIIYRCSNCIMFILGWIIEKAHVITEKAHVTTQNGFY